MPLIPKHKCYVEVFGGAGWLLFAKEPSSVEILNDFDGELINFWSIVQNAPDQLVKSFEYELVSREKFNDCKIKFLNKEYDDNIERAKIFYYLVNAGFASAMDRPRFGTKCQSRNGLRIEEVDETIPQAYKRLQKVTIENKSFENIFKIYDSENTFFYLDPPYRGTYGYRLGSFSDAQYDLLADCCKKSKGKWLLTINDDTYIRELFKDFNIMTHDVFYSISKKDEARKDYKELIITNYNIQDIV